MKNKILILVFGFLALGGIGFGIHENFGGTTQITLENPKEIVWQKPTTDAQWAEDTKKESLDIKSTDVLQTMGNAQTEKLKKEQVDFQKYADMQSAGQDPVQYIYWQRREEISESLPDMKDPQLHDIAMNAAQSEYNQKIWEIEKIQQSIERINKEIELRQKGFLIVDTGKVNFGASMPSNRIRYIHD